MTCRLDADAVCSRCGRRASSPTVLRRCRPGLGDMVAAGLSAVGVTKERADAAAQALGFSGCGCHHRQHLLNEAGRAIGIGGAPEN